MKGPSGRLRHDVRRVWECPVCHRRRRTGGQVVTLSCSCQASNDPPLQPHMRLLEEAPIQSAQDPVPPESPIAAPQNATPSEPPG